jgi:hypothetical protein|tara:strand:+ start:591 stop:1151 length:561 start_codon:yes stop_codon:yes gene_type:complete
MERTINTKACLIELKKDHPYLYEQVFYKDCEYGQADEYGGFYLLEPVGEAEAGFPKVLRRSVRERTILLKGSKAIELQIFHIKRHLDYHKNKTARLMRGARSDFIILDRSLHKGKYKGFSYDVTRNAHEDYVFTPAMSAAEWRKILEAMLGLLKKRYREAKAEERKLKPRKPRRVPFKESMYALAK